LNTKIGGKLVKVKNGKMHVKIMGTGEKTIVYLPGWNEPMPTVESAPLMRELAKKYTVCAVEYFGYGLSDSTDRAHTNENYVEEIREVLSAAGLFPPYILMPYSCSGIYSEYYAIKYPHEIAGIIMLDCTSTAQELDMGIDLIDVKKVEDAVNELIAAGLDIPRIGSLEWEEFVEEYFAKYYEEFLSHGFPKEVLDEEVQVIIDGIVATDVDDISSISSEEWEEFYAKYLPFGYTKEELEVQATTPNDDETIIAQDKMFPENVEEVMDLNVKIADDIPVLVFHAEPVDDEHVEAINDHLLKLGNVKKHIVIEGSDHGTITFYRDIIAKEVDEFLKDFCLLAIL